MLEKKLQCCILLLNLLWLPVGNAAATTISISLSHTEIVKNHSFRNTFITVSGQISNANDIVINIVGPKVKYIIWQQEKQFGIWSKSKSFLTNYMPSYQCMTTSYDQKSFDHFTTKINNVLRYGYPAIMNSQLYDKDEIQAASDAFRQLRKEKHMLTINTSAISISDSKFKVDIPIPSDIEEGLYKVQIYTLKNFKTIGRRTTYFTVNKDMKYQQLRYIAQQYPLLYAIASITVAILVGAAANFIFSKGINEKH